VRAPAVFLAAPILLALSLPSSARAARPIDQPPAPPLVSGTDKTIPAIRADAAPVIDGRDDDALWQAIPPDDRFTQIQPSEGKAPSETTKVRVAYDDQNIYLFVTCLDKEPKGIVSRLTRRDRDIEADWLAVSIDSRNDHASAYTFQLSAAGVQVDGQFFNDSDFNGDWDAVWNGAVTRDAAGWYAEFAIPLTVLRFSDADVQSWGLQVHRNISRKHEQMMWAYQEGGKAWSVSHFGYITGLRGLRPHRAFELRPYAMARVDTYTDRGTTYLGLAPGADSEGVMEVGLDAKIGLTSRLTLDLTVNPDFGQVEADQVVLNLSRFETFFPEKRPFFLEGRDLFETPIQLFYPRRIGRLAVGYGRGTILTNRAGDSVEVQRGAGSLRLWTAGKVTGEIGDHLSIAALGAVTGAEELQTKKTDDGARSDRIQVAPERSYGVMRGRYALGNGDFVGVIATSVNRLDGHIYKATADHDAYSQAADFAWRSTSGRWRTTGQVAVSERQGGPGYVDTSTDGACTELDALSLGNTTCVPIVRPNGQHMESGTVGYGAQVHTAYETKKNIFRVDYLGHSPTFDVNDAGFAPNFDRHELKIVGGWADKEPGEHLDYRGIYPFAIGQIGFDGTPQGALLGLDLEANGKDGSWFTSPEQWILMPKTSDPYETFDGAHFEQPAAWEGHWEAGTSNARMVSLYGNYSWYLGLGDENRSTSLYTKVALQAASNIELSLEPEAGIDHSVRFYDCDTASGKSCRIEHGMNHYTFADLDSKYLSTTFRGTITIAPPLSFQGYAQYFLATGKWSDFKETTTMGSRPTIERAALEPMTGFTYDGASDFKSAQLNVNLVLRWEVDPGSVLYMVYTRGQESDGLHHRLATGPTEDVLLVKFVYYATR
jgi:hypothetical protein